MVNITIGDALKKGIALLKQSNTESAVTDASVLLCHVLGCDRLALTVRRDGTLTDAQKDRYLDFIKRRQKKEPVSYITGTKEFMSLDFGVNPDVLIPRPDTEILAERVIEEMQGIKSPVILDLCTGSGALAVSLARYIEGARITALDISQGALGTAMENARRNGVEVDFVIHDVRVPFEFRADAAVSNPPYIPSADIAGLEPDVADFEPLLALDGGSDGLDFYRAIVSGISSSLKAGGLLAFEVGFGQAEDVRKIMEPHFENICTDKDLSGIDRVVYGRLRSEK